MYNIYKNHVQSVYKSQSTSIYVCFMDASKAFDRVNYWLLFKKLIDTGMLGFSWNGIPPKKRASDGVGLSDSFVDPSDSC